MASFGGEEAVLVEGFGGNATSSVGDEWRWLPTGLECFAASSGDALCLPLLAPVLGLPGGIVLTRDWPAGGGAGVQRAAELRTSLEAEASGTAGLVLFSSTDNWVSLSLEIAAEGGCEAVRLFSRLAPTPAPTISVTHAQENVLQGVTQRL
jgi:hypothetical protein